MPSTCTARLMRAYPSTLNTSLVSHKHNKPVQCLLEPKVWRSTFGPPQTAAHAAFCGLLLLRRLHHAVVPLVGICAGVSGYRYPYRDPDTVHSYYKLVAVVADQGPQQRPIIIPIVPTLFILIPRITALFGGVAVGVITAFWKSLERGSVSTDNLSKTGAIAVPLASTGFSAKVTDIAIQYTALETQLFRLEEHVDRHDEQLLAILSTEQIVVTINRIFEHSSKALEKQFAEQARSIENLKVIMSQTDELLDKVMDAIYSLPEIPRQSEAGPEGIKLPKKPLD